MKTDVPIAVVDGRTVMRTHSGVAVINSTFVSSEEFMIVKIHIAVL
jgi:hypothetical protein